VLHAALQQEPKSRIFGANITHDKNSKISCVRTHFAVQCEPLEWSLKYLKQSDRCRNVSVTLSFDV
jgi:hypothetical protein